MDEQEMMKKFQAPFKVNEIEWRVGSTSKDKTKGLALAYVTNRAIQKRLDEVCGIFGWKNEYREWKSIKQLCGISILFNGEWVTKWDGSDDSNMDGTKGGLSGAMKRCACQWGIGRYLYDIPSQWVEIEQQGKSYKIVKKPNLPKWALPETDTTQVTWNEKEEDILPDIPEQIQKMLNSFEKLNISKTEIENYLNNEAFAFTDNDIEQLRVIYSSIKKGIKTKEDYFYTEVPTKVGRRAKILNKKLTTPNID